MELTISLWDDITKHLNGFVLESVEIRGRSLMAKNSRGEKFLIAERTPAFWAATYGSSFEAVDYMLRNISDQLKNDGIYNPEEKDKLVVQTLDQVARLKTKGYK
jgi:hypothetical protein